MGYDLNNVFFKILNHQISCKKVYENDFALAFHDIFPAAPIHVLVIPKGQYVAFNDFILNAGADAIQGFWSAVQQVTKLLNLEEVGFRLLTNTGAHGGQTVPHFHVHVLGGKHLGPIVVSDRYE